MKTYLSKSNEEFLKGQKVIPGGIKGMHKIFSVEKYPAYYSHGKGCYVYDIDDNQYIDFVMGKGPYILGYCNEQVDKGVMEQIQKGNIFPMGNPYHNMVADKILRHIAGGEHVIFYKSGSCATTAAVRLARAYTGKNVVLSCGYHGWHDWCSNGKGILESVKESFYDFKFNLELFDSYLRKFGDLVAAVIISPEEFYLSQSFYQYIQDVCKERKIVFILDEVKTGFRVSLSGFQGKYGLDPDMSTFSKALSNGYSIAAVVGKKKFLDINEELHTTGTYDTEVISFAAAYECLSILEQLNVPAIIDERGNYFVEQMNRVFKQNDVGLYSVWSNGSFRIWSDNFAAEEAFYSLMADESVLFYAFDNSYISLSHTKEVLDEVINKINSVLQKNELNSKRKYESIDKSLFGTVLKNKKGFLDGYIGVNGRNE